MNAIDPSGIAVAPGSAQADAAHRLVSRLTWCVTACGAAILALRLSAHALPPRPALALFAGSPLAAELMGVLLLLLAGLAGTGAMARTRRRNPAAAGRAARWPQALLVGPLAIAGIACLWLLRGSPDAAGPPDTSIGLGIAVIALAFPLLIAERHFAAMPTSRLPEAPALRALFLTGLLAWVGAGLTQIAAGLGVRYAGLVATLIAIVLSAIALELAGRAVGRLYLPPPAPAAATAAISSYLANAIAAGTRASGIAAPMRRHLGIDMSRSWALSYVRAAVPPVLLMLLLLVWGLSGVVLVGLDQRAIYERLGAPVAVLHPGLHVVLPWPMGRIRRVEFGTIHETTLTDGGAPPSVSAPPARHVGAEERPPPDADRLWEQPHPSEVSFLIASTDGTRQSFQVVSADIRLLYRVGLSDADALRAAYRAADPAALLRGAAGRVLAGFFADRTLDQMLGENRERMAERMREAVQQDLTRIGCGIEVTSVVIEAIHPPAGAAEAYHYVQAAQIIAEASIAAERGRAIASLAKAQQYATILRAQAQATAAEVIGSAQAELTRFNADHEAAAEGGEAFMVDRYLTDLAKGLADRPLIIVDHRIPVPDAPVVDLRPPGGASAPTAGRGLE